jgi:hypothetical protein
MAKVEFKKYTLYVMLSRGGERIRRRWRRNEAIVSISKEISRLSLLKGENIYWYVNKKTQICDVSWKNIKFISNTEILG